MVAADAQSGFHATRELAASSELCENEELSNEEVPDRFQECQ
jgi:hypothetical protein